MRTSLPYIAISLILTIICTSCNYAPCRIDGNGRTAILGAFGEETTLLKKQMMNQRQYQIEDVKFFTGRLENQPVVLAETGIGKVNAAMTTTVVITKFEPDEVIFTGIAGAINPELRPGDIVIAEKIAQHDRGLVTDAGFETQATTNPAGVINPLFFTADRHLLGAVEAAAKEINLSQLETTEGLVKPKIITGVVVTGDSFIASEQFGRRLREKLGADAVEMEGAAVAQVCYQQNVPFIVIRSISDRADKTAVADMQKFQSIAAENSARLVAETVRQLALENSVH
jgi:adenosylhomocysteine nucleosidase